MLKQVAAAALFAGFVLAQDFVIHTPSGVTVCQPTLLDWVGGVPPYFLDILDGDNLSGGSVEPLLTDSQEMKFTWIVNQPSTFKAVAQIRDSTGLTKTTAPFIIADSPNKSCLNGGSSSSSGTATSGSSTSSGSASSSTSQSSSSNSSAAATSTTASTTAPAGSTTATTPAASTTSTTGTTPGTSSKPATTSTTGTGTSNTTGTSASNTPTGAALGQTVPVAGVLAALAAVFFA